MSKVMGRWDDALDARFTGFFGLVSMTTESALWCVQYPVTRNILTNLLL